MPIEASADAAHALREPTASSVAPTPSVVSELVAACIADIDRLVHQYLLEVRQIDGYAAHAVPAQDLEDTAVASMELLLRLVGKLPIPERLAGISETLGHRRAQQGLPLESLLRAVRMDFRIIWTAMLDKVAPAFLPDLSRDAVRVWEAVEFHTIRVHAGYLDELATMAQQKETERAFLLSRFLHSDGLDPQLLGQAARALGVAPESSFIVAVAAEYSHQAFRAEVLRAGVEHCLHERDGVLMLILEDRPARAGREPEGTRSWLVPLDCFVAPPARSLADVPRMLRIAIESLPVLTPGGSGQRTVRAAWGHVAATRLGEYGTVVADAVLGPLTTTSIHERERLIETVQAYFRSGSASEAAEELYCHRNTVLNRLARFSQLTSFDPTNPQDAATVIAALHIDSLP